MKKIILTFIISIISAQTAIASCPIGRANGERAVKTKIKGKSVRSTVVDRI